MQTHTPGAPWTILLGAGEEQAEGMGGGMEFQNNFMETRLGAIVPRGFPINSLWRAPLSQKQRPANASEARKPLVEAHKKRLEESRRPCSPRTPPSQQQQETDSSGQQRMTVTLQQ